MPPETRLNFLLSITVPAEGRAALGVSSSGSSSQCLDPAALPSLPARQRAPGPVSTGCPGVGRGSLLLPALLRAKEVTHVASPLIPVRPKRGNLTSKVMRSHLSPF